jgi:hypothetical protein
VAGSLAQTGGETGGKCDEYAGNMLWESVGCVMNMLWGKGWRDRWDGSDGFERLFL